MAQRVRSGELGYACLPKRMAHRPLNILLVDVVAPPQSRSWIDRKPVRRKYILPCPLARRVRVFAIQRVRQINTRHPRGKILRVKLQRR